MDCNQVRNLVIDLGSGELSPEAREHMHRCAGCQGFLRDTRLMHAGLRALAEEAAPEASMGFTSRLLRRLVAWEGRASQSDFFERVGRRFVYATLALTLALLLSLVLPNSGPVRGVAGSDFLGLQNVSRSSQPDVIGGDIVDSHDSIPERLSD